MVRQLHGGLLLELWFEGLRSSVGYVVKLRTNPHVSALVLRDGKPQLFELPPLSTMISCNKLLVIRSPACKSELS